MSTQWYYRELISPLLRNPLEAYAMSIWTKSRFWVSSDRISNAKVAVGSILVRREDIWRIQYFGKNSRRLLLGAYCFETQERGVIDHDCWKILAQITSLPPKVSVGTFLHSFFPLKNHSEIYYICCVFCHLIHLVVEHIDALEAFGGNEAVLGTEGNCGSSGPSFKRHNNEEGEQKERDSTSACRRQEWDRSST